jgi:iron-sulfur cluster repair protein YtfE (RIC family)
VTSTPPFAPRARTTQEPEPDLTSIVVIHRAIRQDLRRLTACLAEIPRRGAPPSQAHAIGRYTTALFAEICLHLDNEDDILWPMIAATAGQAVDLSPLTDDHQAIQAAAGRAIQALASFRADPGLQADLHAPVAKLRDMLDEHIADEEQQIFPAMRRYLPAEAYRWCEKQIQRKAPLAGLWFTAPWLARHAHSDELSRRLAASGWPGRIVLAATRPGYARLERQAFDTRSPAHDTRHLPNRSFRSSPGGTMFRSHPRRPVSPRRPAQHDALAIRLSRPETRSLTVQSRAGMRLRRMAVILAAATVGLLASAAAIPAAFADIPPAVYGRSRVGPATVHAATAGGPAVWLIALIGIGVPLAATVVTVLLRRARAAAGPPPRQPADPPAQLAHHPSRT